MSKVQSVLFSLLIAAGTANAATIYFNDFESSSAANLGSVVITATSNVNGSSGIDGQKVLWNDSLGNPAAATTLTLTGLNPNEALNLEFTFLAVGSWDGVTYQYGLYAPDYFNVDLNSASIFHGSFRNYNSFGTPEYPGCSSGSNCTSLNYPAVPGNTTLTLQQAAAGDFGTSIYNILVTGINADSSGNASFQFYASGGGWQGGGDESIALDNILVTTSGSDAPEPSTWALIGGGFLALLARRRAFAR